MTVLEGDRTWDGAETGGRAAVGMWHLAKPLTRMDGTAVEGTSGVYGVVEQRLWTGRGAGPGPGAGLAGFLQAGRGDGRVNPYGGHVGGGLVLSGPWRRPEDGAGIAASWVLPGGGSSGSGNAGRSETVIEMYYRMSLGRGVSLVPDVQYFVDPGGRGTPGSAVVVTPRLVFSF